MDRGCGSCQSALPYYGFKRYCTYRPVQQFEPQQRKSSYQTSPDWPHADTVLSRMVRYGTIHTGPPGFDNKQ